MAEAPITAPITIVTGSNRGIGRAIATALAKDGHRLVLVARDQQRLDQVAAELRARPVPPLPPTQRTCAPSTQWSKCWHSPERPSASLTS